MNNKFIKIIKNLSYSLSSNLISLIISTLVVLIVPKAIGVNEYGYWQLYLFYISYVGFFHFGWADGIYLRYAGKEYEELDKKLLFSQFWMLFILQVIIMVTIFILTYVNINDSNKSLIFNMMALNCILVIPRTMIGFILQITNRIKEYSILTLVDRVVYCVLIITLLVFKYNKFDLIIIADIIGKLVGLIYSIYCCRDIVFKKSCLFYFDFKEAYDNISVGIKLLLANIASMLIIGIVRFGIEKAWSVSVFGKVSLTISICNMIMVFINAVSIIVFPMLCKLDKDELKNAYNLIKNVLTIAIFGILILFYPVRYLLQIWLPQYQDSLKYMALLFPMCLYEAKMLLLINSYFKTLRKEKIILIVNSITVFISIISTCIVIGIMKNLNLGILSIVLLLAFRSILSELLLSRILNIKVKLDIYLELIMTAIFIMGAWSFSSYVGMIIYTIAYIVFIIIKRKDIFNNIRKIKSLAIG